MRILIIAMKFFPASGGSATYAHNLAKGLVDNGHEVVVLAPSYFKRRFNDSTLNYKVKRMSLTSGFFKNLRAYAAAFHVFRYSASLKPAVIWASSFGGCRVLSLLPFLRIPMVGTIHGGGIIRCTGKTPNTESEWKLEKGIKFVSQAQRIVTVSEEASRLICRLLPEAFSSNPPKVIYNGIEYRPESFADRSTTQAKYSQYSKRTILLTVGRLVRAKGHDLVLDAVCAVKEKYPDLHYIIVGEGPEKERLTEKVAALGLNDRVTMTGYVSQIELEEYFSLSDLFIMAGRETDVFVEGFGLVFVEASFRGKPVIGTRVGGIPEAIGDGISGLIAEPENLDSLIEKLRTLLDDPEKARALGESGRKWALERFTTSTMAKANADLLSEVITE